MKDKPIDFDVLKEPWIKFEISDGSILKVRTILKKVERVTKEGKLGFNIDAQTITIIHAEPSLKGPPSKKSYSKEEIQKAINKDDMRYNTLVQEFNEYVLDDGSKIKIITNVMKISRTKLYDKTGDPVYFINNSITMDIKPSSQYNLPPPK